MKLIVTFVSRMKFSKINKYYYVLFLPSKLHKGGSLENSSVTCLVAIFLLFYSFLLKFSLIFLAHSLVLTVAATMHLGFVIKYFSVTFIYLRFKGPVVDLSFVCSILYFLKRIITHKQTINSNVFYFFRRIHWWMSRVLDLCLANVLLFCFSFRCWNCIENLE